MFSTIILQYYVQYGIIFFGGGCIKPIDYKEGVVITATELKQNLGKYLDFVEQQQNDLVITKMAERFASLLLM